MSMAIREGRWHVPVRLDVERWATRRTSRRVLVVVHTVTSGQRVLEAVRLLEGDPRVQVCFTAAPDVFSNGVTAFLERLGGLVLPWDQAAQTRFDLALAASCGSLHELHSPVLVLPHGAGHNKMVPERRRGRLGAARGTYGLARQMLVRDGAVIPETIVLAHEEDLSRLGRECPEALPVAAVVGDPCYDRIQASRPSRALYREALRAGARQRLVVVCSTWGAGSLLGQGWELLHRLVRELPREDFRVAALLHPHVWNGHSEWQIRSWLAELGRAGLAVVSQHADWVGPLVAADVIVGDHGSTTLYGTATGAPVLLAELAGADLDPASPMAELLSFAPRLRADRPLARQLARDVRPAVRLRYEHVAGRITSEPGRFARLMRGLLYRKLRLRAPGGLPGAPVTEPAALPRLVPPQAEPSSRVVP
ncbi:hypothetical protein [Streptomyces sp. B8F3]|uniref:hypothetical protein n=1 Tax=unclassified Streptomyces TaxID=2593676 RepID=UPI00325E89F2